MKFDRKSDGPPQRRLIHKPDKDAAVPYDYGWGYPHYSAYLVKIVKLDDKSITFCGVAIETREPLGKEHTLRLNDVANVWADLPSSLPPDRGPWQAGDGEYAILMLSDKYVDSAEASDLKVAAPKNAPVWPPEPGILAISNALRAFLARVDSRYLEEAAKKFPELGLDAGVQAGAAVNLVPTERITAELKVRPFRLPPDGSPVTLHYLISAPDKGYRPVLAQMKPCETAGKIRFDLLDRETLAPTEFIVDPGDLESMWPIHPSYSWQTWQEGSGEDCGVLFLSHRLLRVQNISKESGGPNKWPKGTDIGIMEEIRSGALGKNVDQFVKDTLAEVEGAAQPLRDLVPANVRSGR